MKRRRLAFSVAAMIGAAGVAPSARAQAVNEAQKAQCANAHERGQRLRLSGALREARTQLLVCGRSDCPSWMTVECASLLEAIDRSMPTVVLRARALEEKGAVDLVDAHVTVDGSPFADRIDGRALAIDPGEHVFRFDAPPRAPLSLRLVIREGEKSRLVSADFPASGVRASAAAAGTDHERWTIPWPAYVLGGVAIAGAASFTYFGLRGWSEQRDVLDACGVWCTQDQIDSVHDKYVIADISLVVGVVSLGAAIAFVLTGTGSDHTSTRARAAVR